MANDVRRNDDANRYEIVVDGAVAGFARYRIADDLLVFHHTEVDDDHEGEGLGSRLVRGALDDVRARGEQIVPQCPFVRRFIEQHDEYGDLVAAAPDA
jgi:uncharacterized protein